MLTNEFVEKTGRSVNEFPKWNEVYMNAEEDMKQNAFCAALKELTPKTEALVLSLSRMVSAEVIKRQNAEHDAEMAIQSKNEAIKESEDKIASIKSNFAKALIFIEVEHDASDIRSKAIDLLGESGYIKSKIALGYHLTEADEELICNLLS